MMKFSSLSSAVCACVVLIPSLSAQDWAGRILQRWPGDTIRKVSESEFRAFVGAAVDKAAAQDVFLGLQYAALDMVRPAAGPQRNAYPSPSTGRELPRGPRITAGVIEGAEPNGDPNGPVAGTPTPVVCGDQGEGAVFPFGDRDWWQFSVTQDTGLTVYTLPGLGASVLADTMLTVRDAAGNVLAANDDDPQRGGYSRIDVDLTAGSYFVEVRGYVDVRTGSYALDLVCGAPGGGGGGSSIPEGPEPNGSGATATLLGCGNRGAGDVNPVGDSDWWQFDLTAAATITATTSAGTTGTPNPDTTLGLYDSNFRQLAFNDDAQGLYSQINIALQPGTYFLDVRGYANRNAGTYGLELVCDLSGPTIPEGPEPNDTNATATPLQCGESGQGTVGSNGDVDWWMFSLSSTTDVVGSTRAGTNPISDTTLALLDMNGQQLAFNDDANGLYSEISIQLAAGTYFFAVAGYQTNTGDYFVDLSCSGSGGGNGGARFVTAPGGCAGTVGVPALGARSGEVPVLGSTFAVEVVGCPAGAQVFPFVGFSTTQTSSGLALPLDLTTVGAPGCSLEVDPLVINRLTADAAGATTSYVSVPADQALVGASFYVQAIVFDANANGLGAVLSNRGEGTIGGR